MPVTQQEVTRLLHNMRAGDGASFDQLFPVVYEDLRGIARRLLKRERAGHTLSTTGLVHESYLNLVGQVEGEGAWRDRAHFFAIASRAMRHILIDYARRRMAKKRGGGRQRVTLEDRMVSVEEQAAELLALDEALTRLAEHSPRMSTIVECRFFGGMTMPEIAEALGLAQRTVEREWTRAKAHLQQSLQP